MTIFSLLVTAFAAGVCSGIVGMACMAYGHKTHLMRENRVMRDRLQFLEAEGESKRFKPVPDPRPRVHSLVN